jgi:3'(2'), 5'-bisphosphate nucleotidase
MRLAKEAGKAAMDYYQAGLDVEFKAGEEPVTAADRVADELIRSGLSKVFPRDGLLTEESEDDRSRLDKERVWIVDPLDGTTEFIAQTDEFVVQIALTLAGEPVLGVVYQPPTAHLYYAIQGQGAYQVCKGTRTRLRVSDVAIPSRMRLVASRSHYSSFVERARQRLGIDSVEQLGSVGLKVGLLAEGVCDLYLATTVAKEWDLCAPHAVLSEAGGVLTNLCGVPLVYNQARVAECRGLVGSNGRAHERIVEALASLHHQDEE